MIDWNALNNSRKVWQPNNPSKETSKASQSISRCLALTPLEPAVADFINLGIDRADKNKLGDVAIQTLLRNIEDEEKHELALTRAKNAMTDYNPSHEKEAQELISAWKSLPDPEILKAAVLENSVFFIILPIYNNFAGSALAITANSISADERLHVQSHRAAAQMLGVRPSKAMNQLRMETVRFISADLEREAGKNWSIDLMLKRSYSLLTKGVSDLIETRASQVIAPFELNSQHIEVYG